MAKEPEGGAAGGLCWEVVWVKKQKMALDAESLEMAARWRFLSLAAAFGRVREASNGTGQSCRPLQDEPRRGRCGWCHFQKLLRHGRSTVPPFGLDLQPRQAPSVCQLFFISWLPWVCRVNIARPWIPAPSLCDSHPTSVATSYGHCRGVCMQPDPGPFMPPANRVAESVQWTEPF